MEAQVLDTPAVREARRKKRRAARTQQEQGLRILSTSARQASRGRLDRAGQTIMQGFGRIVLDAIAKKLKGQS
jgi:hypothetical protein